MMDGIHKFSNQMIELAERVSDVADAANGKGRRSSRGTRWVLLPAAGAALYALVKSDFFARQAKSVANGAKTRAADLPSDLMSAVRQASEKPKPASTNGARASSGRTSSRRSGTRSTRSRSTTSAKSKR